VTEPTYIIGIDLGTTNSVVAYTEAQIEPDREPQIHIFNIPQLVGPGSMENGPTLPSFVLLPGPHDVPQGGLQLPWSNDNKMAVGRFARDRGAEIPHRLIASAKSWLCHTGIDRNKQILPWEGPDDVEKLSPVEASAAILRHIRDAWNYTMAAEDENLRLEHQEVFLTVPASFDAVARDLTVEAARMAGLSGSTLLEEPQAAFYAWINATSENWRDQVKVGDRILVTDIGGGTTDLSLIEVSEEEGKLVLERVAVGQHLLVGGDNMDLTLAYSIANRMAANGRKLDAHQMRGLCHGCRAAKEHLFENPSAEGFPITILSRGSKLIGGSIKAELVRSEMEEILANGFLPQCDSTVQPKEQLRTGVRELGLSYTSDPAITHHLANFLNQQKPNDSGPICPTAVLFNGGVMKAQGLRKRVLTVLGSWAEDAGREPPREIGINDFDLAVARGAACYGLARRGKGIRIRGGLSRTYYIGIEASMPAVPGMPTPVMALCVAPFGMEEGTEASLSGREFGLVVGEPVRFDFLGSTTRQTDSIGTVVDDWQGDIEKITTVETVLEGETGTLLPVTMDIKATEVGTLELWCVSTKSDQKFRLEFNVRERTGE
jgi:hypothetical protein